MLEALILHYYNYELSIRVETDTSNEVIARVLLQ
jgi:hypothetical protein